MNTYKCFVLEFQYDFALSVKAVILVLGALAIAIMWEAMFGDVGVSVIIILNAMRAMHQNQ